LLLNATHKEYEALFRGRSIKLQPGQLITGRRSIAAFLKINENKVQRILKLLKNEHLIEQQACNRNRLITILSWNKYQKTEQQNKQQVNNRRTTGEQQVNTNNNDNNVNNNVNNNNKSPKNSAPVFEAPKSLQPSQKNKKTQKPALKVEIPENLKTDAFYKAWDEWQEHRKQIKKKLTPLAAKKQIKKLSEMGLDRAIKAINYSITNGWQGIFEPNKQTKSQNSQGSWLEDLQNIDLEA
jgi:DNA-binding transcriptional regulator YhcF (GntR family)